MPKADGTSARDIASTVLGCVGGTGNIVSNSLCMTRLRLRLTNTGLVDEAALEAVPGVLGLAARGSDGIEVVFGPRLIGDVYDSFVQLTGRSSDDVVSGTSPLSSSLRVTISRSPQQAAQGEKVAAVEAADDDLAGLDELMEREDGDETYLWPDDEFDEQDDADQPAEDGLKLLVINGPNINMVGIREPGVYGHQTYDDLLLLCKQTAREVGFSVCSCFQSNHEGDIVDRIQDAYQVFDGIVINPGAYTHTSIAILDALKAVSIPTVEVHISKVDEREEFRQVSYVRAACFETVAGLGIDGYRKAIEDLYAHLAQG